MLFAESVFTVISNIHAKVDKCRQYLANERGLFWWFDRTIDSEHGLHLDDVAEADEMMAVTADTLRVLAHEVEMRRIAIKASALKHRLDESVA